MTRKELERLVQEMADGSLSQDGFQRLQEELRQKPKARAFFRSRAMRRIISSPETPQMHGLPTCTGRLIWYGWVWARTGIRPRSFPDPISTMR